MNGCIFCTIASGKGNTKPVYENEHCFAFHDLNPQAPTHILIIPKIHLTSLNEIGNAPDGLMGHLMKATRDVAGQLGVDQEGYRVVMNTGPDGGQTVSHLHIHLLGGRPMRWPPG